MKVTVHVALCLGVLPWGLAGCQQEDPDDLGAAGRSGGGVSDAGLVMPADAEEALDLFYPAVDGAYWKYNHTGGSEVWQEEVNMEDVTFEGEAAILQRDTPGPSGTHSESTLTRQDAGIFRVSKQVYAGRTRQEKADYDPGFVRFHGEWVMQGEGYSETLSYRRQEHTADGMLLHDGDREHTYTVEAVNQEVTVPAGTFQGCIHIHRLRVRGTNDPVADGDDKEYWFCPGIGKVRELEPLAGKREVLLECDVPGGACP